jgi:hypothetical protein
MGVVKAPVCNDTKGAGTLIASWLRWTTAEIQRLRIELVVAPSKDGRAICEGVAAVDADAGSPAEGFADVKGLRR